MKTTEKRKLTKAQEQEGLLKQFIVVKDNEDRRHITHRENFRNMPICEGYDLYGQQISEYDCGCEDSSGEYHTEETGMNYHDGQNHCTAWIGDGGLAEVDDESAIEFIRAYLEADFNDFNAGKCTVDVGDLTLVRTQFSSDPWLAWEEWDYLK